MKRWAIIDLLPITTPRISPSIMMYFFRRFVLIFSLLIVGTSIQAQQTRLLFILDASNSMNARWDESSRWDAATQTLTHLLDSIEKAEIDNLQLALRVFGHQRNYPPQHCDDTKLEVPFKEHSLRHMRQRVKSLKARGTTPLALSLERAANDFPPCSDCLNLIIIITDGMEECDGDPCAASALLQKQGISIRPYIIGLGMDDAAKIQMDCIGRYFPARTAAEFQKNIQIVVNYSLEPSTAQLNLLDANGKNTETDVAFSLIDHHSGKDRYHFMHTLNRKGNPDTLHIDPGPVYDLIVHSIPPQRKDSITLSPGRHSILSMPLARSKFQWDISGSQAYKNLQAIVYRVENGKRTQRIHTPERQIDYAYLLGEYEIELLTVPVSTERFSIVAGQKTAIKLISPGTVSFQASGPVVGQILHKTKNGWESIYELDQENSRQNMAMQPGQYMLVYRPKNARDQSFSQSQSFRVNSGGSVVVKLR